MTAGWVESIERSRRAICEVSGDRGTTAASLCKVVWVSSGGRDGCRAAGAAAMSFTFIASVMYVMARTNLRRHQSRAVRRGSWQGADTARREHRYVLNGPFDMSIEGERQRCCSVLLILVSGWERRKK